MTLIRYFLLDTTSFKASIITCLLGNLGSEEVKFVDPQIDRFETMIVFEDSTNELYLTRASVKKFNWKQNFIVALKEFKVDPASEVYRGEAITVTLFKKPDHAEQDIIPVCEVTFINHSIMGLLRKIWLDGYTANSLEEIDEFELIRKQFLRSFVLFLQHNPSP